MNATAPLAPPARLYAYDRECRRGRSSRCAGCNGEVDDDTCHCGDSLAAHWDPFAMNHMFVPSGCVCYTGVRLCDPRCRGACTTSVGTRLHPDRALAHLTAARPVQRQEGMNTDLYTIATGPSVTGGFVGTLTIGVGAPQVTPSFPTEREAFDAALDLALDTARERLATP